MTELNTFREHPIHPHYGPCDAMGDGESCFECCKVVAGLRDYIKGLEEIRDYLADAYRDGTAQPDKFLIQKINETLPSAQRLKTK